MVVAAEVERGRNLAESLVKALTGGDTITARFLHKEFFEFRPTFKIFLATNHKPNIRGTDHAIWRRIRLVPFMVTIPDNEQDKKLPDKLRDEAPGILAWIVRGCLEWQREGLGAPAEIRSATHDYRTEQDILGRFLDECTQVSDSNEVSAGTLYEVYQWWCSKNGEHIDNSTRFGRAMSERGFTRGKDPSTRRKTYKGFEPIPNTLEEFEEDRSKKHVVGEATTKRPETV